jgi:hypothetical protein
MTLAEQLQRSRVAQWDANEQALKITTPQTPLTPDVLGRIDIFGKWCEAKGVRKCACKPWIVATYLLEKSAEGVPAEPLLATLAAVAALHDYHGLSNPVATRVVNLALEQILREERPPRSWNKDELIEWRLLPAPIRNAISRRENERDRALSRRLQADKERLQTAPATKPVITSKRKNQHMTKRDDSYKGGQGIDGSKHDSWVVKQVDKKAEREQFGSVADVTPKHPGKA